MIRQTTLAAPVSTGGIGLHTGAPVNLRLVPAPPDTGYVFVRTDLDDYEIPASAEYISHCSYATTLMRGGVMLSTVEHLLAALRGAGVDNCYVEIDNIEMPIADGSSEPFLELIERAGMHQQNAPRRLLQIRETVEVVQNNRRMRIEPHEGYEINCLIEFAHPLINRQTRSFALRDNSFAAEIARARTFGFVGEVEMLRRSNLALGGSLDNAIVLSDDGILNPTPLRYKDEFVRHKILDIIGDLSLLGLPILGKITAERSGHSIHAALMAKLLRTRSAWEIVEAKSSKFQVSSSKA